MRTAESTTIIAAGSIIVIAENLFCRLGILCCTRSNCSSNAIRFEPDISTSYGPKRRGGEGAHRNEHRHYLQIGLKKSNGVVVMAIEPNKDWRQCRAGRGTAKKIVEDAVNSDYPSDEVSESDR